MADALRKEQDEAYFASLEEDKRKEAARREAEERAELDRAIELSRQWQKECLAKEKAERVTSEPPEGKGVCLTFQMPEERVSRRFEEGCDSEVVFDWVESREGGVEVAAISPGPMSATHSVRRDEARGKGLEEVGFRPGVLLFVAPA